MLSQGPFSLETGDKSEGGTGRGDLGPPWVTSGVFWDPLRLDLRRNLGLRHPKVPTFIEFPTIYRAFGEKSDS